MKKRDLIKFLNEEINKAQALIDELKEQGRNTGLASANAVGRKDAFQLILHLISNEGYEHD